MPQPRRKKPPTKAKRNSRTEDKPIKKESQRAHRKFIKGSDPIATLAQLGSPVYLRPAASERAIRQMQRVAQRDLGEQVPDGYIALLKLTNGVQINGAYFKTAEHLVLENLDVPRPGIIVLGADGMAEYIFDRKDRRFHMINMGFESERFSSFDSFGEMLIGVLREQQAL